MKSRSLNYITFDVKTMASASQALDVDVQLMILDVVWRARYLDLSILTHKGL